MLQNKCSRYVYKGENKVHQPINQEIIWKKRVINHEPIHDTKSSTLARFSSLSTTCTPLPFKTGIYGVGM